MPDRQARSRLTGAVVAIVTMGLLAMSACVPTAAQRAAQQAAARRAEEQRMNALLVTSPVGNVDTLKRDIALFRELTHTQREAFHDESNQIPLSTAERRSLRGVTDEQAHAAVQLMAFLQWYQAEEATLKQQQSLDEIAGATQRQANINAAIARRLMTPRVMNCQPNGTYSVACSSN